MSSSLRCVPAHALIAGWDFSTGSVKALAFDLQGSVVAEVRFPTDLWTQGNVSELNLLHLEGQARATTRGLIAQLKKLSRERDLLAGGISATHHTASRIDEQNNPIRRAICWNDQTLAKYHAEGLQRLGGQDKARELTGGPWAVRYSLSHLVKDEQTLSEADWVRTRWILSHGSLSAGYLTGRFDCASISSAASTGILDLRSGEWNREMLNALAKPEHQELAWKQLPPIIDLNTPIGHLSANLALECDLPQDARPLIFPTLDDQAAGLVGGGAVDAGQVAVILGNSAVVNSSSSQLTTGGSLDVMRLNWGPYLWMRCYSNGAQFLDRVVGSNPDWAGLEAVARQQPVGSGAMVLPFILSEPSIGVNSAQFRWLPSEPENMGVKFRASLEALSYLIAMGVKEHEAAGQRITRITVSGGIARSELMGEILASVLNRPIERLVSSEGPALGAAVVALAGLENHLRKQQGIAEPFSVADSVTSLVKFRTPVQPVSAWVSAYQEALAQFEQQVRQISS
jgi:xylulokinase